MDNETVKQFEKQGNEIYRKMAKQMRITADAIDENVNCRTALPDNPTMEQMKRVAALNEQADYQRFELERIFTEAKNFGEQAHKAFAQMIKR